MFKKHLSEIALVVSLLSGFTSWAVAWGKIQAHVDDKEGHVRTETTEAQEKRLDGIENRLEDMGREQRKVNESVIQSLGRIEGRLGTNGQ